MGHSNYLETQELRMQDKLLTYECYHAILFTFVIYVRSLT